MIVLRPRRRLTSSDRRQSPRGNVDAGVYYADEADENSSDEADELNPFLPGSRPMYAIPVTKSLFCVKIVFFFGLAGVVFLSTIAYLLRTNSSYISITLEEGMSKPKLANGVVGAVIMYLVMCSMSGILWYNNINSSKKQSLKK